MTLNKGFHFVSESMVDNDPFAYVQNCVVFTDAEDALNAQLPDQQIAVLLNAKIAQGNLIEQHQEAKRIVLEWLNSAPKTYLHQRESPPQLVWKNPLSSAAIDRLYERKIGVVSVRYPHQMIMCDIYSTTEGVPIHEVRGIAMFVKALLTFDEQSQFEPLDHQYWAIMLHHLEQLKQRILQHQLILTYPGELEVHSASPSIIQVRVGGQRIVIEQHGNKVRVNMFLSLAEALVNIFGVALQSPHKLDFPVKPMRGLT